MSSVTGQYNGYLVPILLLLLPSRSCQQPFFLAFKEPGSRAGKIDTIRDSLSFSPSLKIIVVV